MKKLQFVIFNREEESKNCLKNLREILTSVSVSLFIYRDSLLLSLLRLWLRFTKLLLLQVDIKHALSLWIHVIIVILRSHMPNNFSLTLTTLCSILFKKIYFSRKRKKKILHLRKNFLNLFYNIINIKIDP